MPRAEFLATASSGARSAVFERRFDADEWASARCANGEVAWVYARIATKGPREAWEFVGYWDPRPWTTQEVSPRSLRRFE
jgi:hypothetical protein